MASIDERTTELENEDPGVIIGFSRERRADDAKTHPKQ
jgi:hypothetical protein